MGSVFRYARGCRQGRVVEAGLQVGYGAEIAEREKKKKKRERRTRELEFSRENRERGRVTERR